MKKIKAFAFLVSLLFFWWTVWDWVRGVAPLIKRRKENQLQKYLTAAPSSECIIIYNAGGWGNTSLEKATDFLSIVLGIQKELKQWNYRPIVVPYKRTKENILGKVSGLKEITSYFRSQSRQLAGQVNDFLKTNPDKKVIMTGLSMGAFFADETLRHIKNKSAVFAVKVGVPFYSSHFSSENVIEINDAKDVLAEGNIKILAFVFAKGFKKWILAKLKKQPLSFGKAMSVPGHIYSWDFPSVREPIIKFLGKNFKILKKT